MTTTKKAVKKVEKEAKAETPEMKIAEISKEVARVEKEASGMVVKTKEDYEAASAFLSSVVKPRVNRIKELVEFFTAPHKKARQDALNAMRDIDAMFAKTLAPLENIERNVKAAMSGYLREEDAKARKEEARLAALREKQNERREEKGQDAIVAPLPTIERSEATVKSDVGGKTTAKKVWKFEIENASQLPSHIVNEVLRRAADKGIVSSVIRDAVSGGAREIAGVRIYEDFDISATGAR